MIQSDDSTVLIIIILAIVAFAIWLGRFKWGKAISPALIVLFFGLFLSNVGVLPFSSPVYNWIVSYLVPIAIPLLLFKTNLRHIFSESGHLFVLFCVGALATVIGGIIGFLILPLGPDAEKIMGMLTATYIGGSVNFVTVSQVLEINDPNLISSAITAENIIGTIYLVFLTIAATSNPIHYMFSKDLDRHRTNNNSNIILTIQTQSFNYWKSAILLSLSVIIFMVSKLLTEWLSLSQYNLLLVTFLAVIVANIFPSQIKKIKGDFELGLLFMYIFFVVIGAGSNIGILFSHGPVLLIYAFTICLIHFSIIALFAKIMGFSLPELITASNACILGPATAVALAAHNKWSSLITPGLLCGLFGYVIANLIGVSLALWLG